MTKKTTTGVTLLVAALGIWAGYRAWGSAPMTQTMYAGCAIFGGANLIFITVLWFRARPGSGEALFLPFAMLLSVSLLVGLVPRLLWPSAESLQIGASVVSVLLSIGAFVMVRRRVRTLRARQN